MRSPWQGGRRRCHDFHDHMLPLLYLKSAWQLKNAQCPVPSIGVVPPRENCDRVCDGTSGIGDGARAGAGET
eukprot:9501393-Pyramimonas_sp.AAC.1